MTQTDEFPPRLDLAALAGHDPPPRRWLWKKWIPAATVSLLHGYGGTGKTLLAQQICSAHVIGRALFGAEMTPGPALMLAGEDDHDEMWRRQADICEAWGAEMAEMAEGLHIIPCPDMDLTVAEVDAAGVLHKLPALTELRKLMEDTEPSLVALDNAARLFAAPEINRRAVTQSVLLLHRLCAEFQCTVLLLGHDNKTGEYSGSTAWENAVRSRLHLKRTEDGEAVDLIREKTNYGKPGEGTVRMVWENGLYHADMPEAMTPGERAEANLRRREDAEVFLAALDKLTAQGRAVSDSRKATTYAPRFMVEKGLAQGRTKERLAAAMELLLNEGRIVANAPAGKYGNGSTRYGLVRPVQASA